MLGNIGYETRNRLFLELRTSVVYHSVQVLALIPAYCATVSGRVSIPLSMTMLRVYFMRAHNIFELHMSSL